MKKLTIILLILFSSGMINSCKNRREKTAEKILEKSIGDNATVDIKGDNIIINTDKGKIVANTGEKKWPKEIPSKVPEFKYGKVKNVSLREYQGIKSWVIVFEKVPKDVLSDYQKILKNKGFETGLVGRTDVGGMLTGENGDLKIAVMAGEGNASFTVSIENQ